MDSSRTYVGLIDDDVIGYHTIVVGQALHADAPERVVKGMPRHPIPLLILARLAVHVDWQGRGVGAGLLLDAMGRVLQVAEIAGVHALAVHAKDERAAAFYERFGFMPSPTDSRHLMMPIKDIRAAAEVK